MITNRQETLIRQSWSEARAINGQLVTFWQDHFYTRDRKWGYPVCVQVQNTAENKVEVARILHWSSSKAVCDSLVNEVDAFIEQLDKEGEHV